MTIAFNLDTKGSTNVKILDSDYNPVFSDQANVSGSYFKQFSLPKNGVYYLHVKQGNASIVKRIVKE